MSKKIKIQRDGYAPVTVSESVFLRLGKNTIFRRVEVSKPEAPKVEVVVEKSEPEVTPVRA